MEFSLWWNKLINLRREYVQNQNVMRQKVSLLTCRTASKERRGKNRHLFCRVKAIYRIHIKNQRGIKVVYTVVIKSHIEIYLRVPNDTK